MKEPMREYGNRCHNCLKRRKSRMYHRMVRGRFIRLCKECWDKIEGEQPYYCPLSKTPRAALQEAK